MTNEVDQPRQGRGRGRPRMPEEDKKRHSITFRMRTELRMRYADKAEQNGCSISEEIERTLEKDTVVSDVILQKDEIISQLRNSMLAQQDLIRRYGDFCKNLQSHNDGIVSLIGSFFERTIRNLDEKDNIVVNFGKKNEAEELLSEIKKLVDRGSVPSGLLRDASTRHAGLSASGEAVLQSLAADLRPLANGSSDHKAGPSQGMHPRMPMAADLPSTTPRRNDDFSTAALRDFVAQFRGGEPDLEALRAAGWPVLFGLLPTGTRTALIGELRDGAPDVYQALMSPTGTRGEALTALRRLQNVLLPCGEDDGPDEDLGDVGGRQAKARR